MWIRLRASVITDILMCMTGNTDTFALAVAGAVRAELSRRQRSASEVAAAIGMSRTTMSERLNGKGAFDIAQLDLIAGYLDIPVDRIFESARLGRDEAVAS